MVNFAHDMTGRTLGQALAQAKLDYLARDPNVYDAKALEEATFYGIPMFSIGGPDTDVPPAANPVTDTYAGQPAAPFIVGNPTGSSNWHLNGTDDGGYYTLANQQQNSNGLTAVEQHQPIQPRVDLNVTQTNQTATGVLVTALSSQDDPQFDPVLSRPTINDSDREPEQQLTNVNWPLTVQGLGTVPALAGGIHQTASLTLGQFRSAGLAQTGPAAGKTIGVQRRFTQMNGEVLYGQNSGPGTPAPYFQSVTATNNGSGGSTITAIARSSSGVSISTVLALVHLNGTNGAWTLITLTGSGSTFTGTTSLSGQYLEIYAEAVDAYGQVGTTFIPGAIYDPSGTGTNPGPAASTTAVSAAASATLGTATPVTVTVTGPSGVATTPSGDVTVSDGAGATCTATLNSGTGTCGLTHANVGSYTITATFPTTNAFTGSSGTTTSAVTPAPLTITASSGSNTYGTAPTVTPTYSGFVLGDTSVATPPTCTSSATAASAPGTYTNSCSGAASPRYTISYAPGTQTVTNGVLTVTAPGGTHAYGSTAALTPTYSGFVNGDTAASLTTQPTCTGVTASSVPGSYTVTCSGGVSSKYTFAYTPATYTVNKAPLTITASSQNSTYGTAPAAITPVYTGFVLGQGSSVLSTQPTCTTSATATSPANSYGTSCTGAAAANYTIAYATGTVVVGKANLNVTASSASRAYGAANPAITASITGFKNGESASILTSAPTCSTNAGPGAFAGGTYSTSCSGASAANYTFTYFDGCLTITKAPLTVVGPSAGRTYGAANPAFTPTYTGFVNGDSATAVSTAPSCTTAATVTSHVGSYPITCSGGASTNYAFTTYTAGSLTVSQATLTVTASNGSRTYGAANPAFTPSYSGFLNGDTSAKVSPAPSCVASAAVANSPVGTYPSLCGGADAQDYTFVYTPGTLTITKAALTITASNVSRTYGSANPTIAPTYAGFVAGDTAASLSTAPTCLSLATPGSLVGGSYSTTCDLASAGNYTISYVPGTLTVTKAPLTVNGPGAAKVYGTANPALTPGGYAGFVNGEDASAISTPPACTTTATTASPVGTYPVTCSGGTAANYTFATYVAGSLQIGKSVLTATANTASRTYGAANPALTVTYTGFVNGDNASVVTTPATCTTPATAASNVGSYYITCDGAKATNYAFSYVDGTLSVTPAAVTINAPNATRVYGAPNPTFTATYTGLQNGQTTLTPAATCTAPGVTAASAPGTYAIQCIPGGLSPNYAVSAGPNGVLTITKAPTVITQTPVSLIGTILALQLRYTAILKSAATGAPIAGEQVTFSTTNTTTGNAGCTATTDANGTATCTSNLLGILTVLVNGNTTAAFAGDSKYNASSNTTAFTLN